MGPAVRSGAGVDGHEAVERIRVVDVNDNVFAVGGFLDERHFDAADEIDVVEIECELID